MGKIYRKEDILGTNSAVTEEAYLTWMFYHVRDGIFIVPLECILIKQILWLEVLIRPIVTVMIVNNFRTLKKTLSCSTVVRLPFQIHFLQHHQKIWKAIYWV